MQPSAPRLSLLSSLRGLRFLTLILATLLAMGTVSLSASSARADECYPNVCGGGGGGGTYTPPPAFGPASTATFVIGEYGETSDFVPVAGTNVTVTLSGGSWRTYLTLHPDGRIDGTPSAAPGTFTANLVATDDQGRTAATTVTVTIVQRPTHTTATTATATAGSAFTFPVTTWGDPTPSPLTATGLPNGLSLTDHGDGTGTITGTPALGTDGYYDVTITAGSYRPQDATSQHLGLTVSKAVFTTGHVTVLDGGNSVGGVLTVSTIPGTPVYQELKYQWQRDGVDIPDATDTTYTNTVEDYQHQIRVEVTAIRDSYEPLTVTTNSVTVYRGALTVATAGSLSGPLRVGGTVTLTPPTFDQGPVDGRTVTWYRDGRVVSEGDALTYTVTAADRDKQIDVVVVSSKYGYDDHQHAVTGAVAGAGVWEATGTLFTSGTYTVGTRIWAFYNGTQASPMPESTAVQWLRDGEPIPGANAAAYTLTGTDLGRSISVRLTGSKPGYDDMVLTTTGKQVARGTFTAVPTANFDGPVRVGERVTATVVESAPSADSEEIQWLSDGTPIAGATGLTYTPTATDLNTQLSVRVTAVKDGYYDAVGVSAPAVVEKGLLEAAVSMTGTAKVAGTLTAEASVSPAAELTYQWFRDGVAITDATGATYKLRPFDSGRQVHVALTATKDGYGTVVKTSEPVKVSPGTFVVSPTVEVTGRARVDSTLTATPSIGDPADAELTYQWLRDGVAITSATDATYKLAKADIGTRIHVTLTATVDGYDSAVVSSDPTDPVAANPAPVVSLNAKTSTRVGHPVTLTWKTTHAETVTLTRTSNGAATTRTTVAATGILSVPAAAAATHRYQITATGPGGNTSATTTVRVLWAAKKLPVSLSSPLVMRGATTVIRVGGLNAGERYTVTIGGRVVATGTANSAGRLTRRVRVRSQSAGSATRVVHLTVTGSQPDRSTRTVLRVLAPKRLRLIVKSRGIVRANHQAVVKVTGLAPREKVTARYRGLIVSAKNAKANRHGVAVVRFNVRRDWGKRLLVVTGAHPSRTARKHLSVYPYSAW